MPKLGESVTEGTINSWLVKVGDTVEQYDPIADVMTDKVNAEVPASFTGVIKEISVEEGETVEVGALIGYMEVEGASGAESQEEKQKPSTTSEPENNEKTTVPKDPSTQGNQSPINKSIQDTSQKTRYSPAVMRLASEHNIDLSTMTGSG